MKDKRQASKPIGIILRVTPDQLETIHKRMKAANTNNREAFLRKMALDGFILEIDDTPIKEMNRLLRSISNNFNQVAKLANSTGRVYEIDISDMRQKMDHIWEMQNQLIMCLSSLK